jgi:hypothetical protein
MRDAGNEAWDDVGDDFRWLSYDEIGQACGISTASAIRLAFGRKWLRREGNDGTVKVAVPFGEAGPLAEGADIEIDTVGRDVGEIVGLLETAATMLRERGEAADGLMAALLANAEAGLTRAEAAATMEREARRRAEASRADAEASRANAEAARANVEAARANAEAALVRLREDLERINRDAEARLTAEQGAREKAEAEAAELRQADQVRRARGLVARLFAAIRGE